MHFKLHNAPLHILTKIIHVATLTGTQCLLTRFNDHLQFLKYILDNCNYVLLYNQAFYCIEYQNCDSSIGFLSATRKRTREILFLSSTDKN